MTKTTVRILIVAFLVVLVYGGAVRMQQGLRPPSVELPAWDVNDLPMRIGEWEGVKAEFPPKIAQRMGAHSSINRSYRQRGKEPIAFHMAIFDQYDVGSFHNPATCYRASGWELVDNAPLRIETAEETPVSIALSTWEDDGNRVTVAHWYQLGDHVATDRFQLGGARWALQGCKNWPAMVKVLMHTSTDNVERSEEGMQELASFVYRWLNDPDFRKSCTTITTESGNGGGISHTAG